MRHFFTNFTNFYRSLNFFQKRYENFKIIVGKVVISFERPKRRLLHTTHCAACIDLKRVENGIFTQKLGILVIFWCFYAFMLRKHTNEAGRLGIPCIGVKLDGTTFPSRYSIPRSLKTQICSLAWSDFIDFLTKVTFFSQKMNEI